MRIITTLNILAPIIYQQVQPTLNRRIQIYSATNQRSECRQTILSTTELKSRISQYLRIISMNFDRRNPESSQYSNIGQSRVRANYRIRTIPFPTIIRNVTLYYIYTVQIEGLLLLNQIPKYIYTIYSVNIQPNLTIPIRNFTDDDA